ncbi:hypothetical protein EK21DRAFT_110931 [Setomelanomma holmii]|uniref:Uncharacterized protein n=1 Tax=Setomelanomma holmii TaxID=210430 RepID=A0A9P4LLI0_9PLEO|nr:hypothetical protein EK21DRAFT_110931 [Setomelanomma holmii]
MGRGAYDTTDSDAQRPQSAAVAYVHNVHHNAQAQAEREARVQAELEHIAKLKRAKKSLGLRAAKNAAKEAAENAAKAPKEELNDSKKMRKSREDRWAVL